MSKQQMERQWHCVVPHLTCLNGKVLSIMMPGIFTSSYTTSVCIKTHQRISPLQTRNVVHIVQFEGFFMVSSRTKKFVPPSYSDAFDHKVLLKYHERSNEHKQLSVLEWLRNFNHFPLPPLANRSGNTLVDVKYISLFKNKYFFQYLLMNYSHRRISKFLHTSHDNLPQGT